MDEKKHPILERLMQRVTPETLQKTKRIMFQDVIDNMVEEYQSEIERQCYSYASVGLMVKCYRRGLEDISKLFIEES